MNLKVNASFLGEYAALSKRSAEFILGPDCSNVKIQSNQTNLDELVFCYLIFCYKYFVMSKSRKYFKNTVFTPLISICCFKFVANKNVRCRDELQKQCRAVRKQLKRDIKMGAI